MSLPGEAQDDDPTYILASRLQPSPPANPSGLSASTGVQQIMLLPRISKACILCNGVLTFHSLPELSPAYGTKKVINCIWIGGQDLDISGGDSEGDVIMVCIASRIRLLKIGEGIKVVKNIEYPGCLQSVRRSRFACVADSHSYALLDVDNQQKIGLFPISSVSDSIETVAGDLIQDLPSAQGTQLGRSSSSAQARPKVRGIDQSSHNRSSSLGTFAESFGRGQPESRSRSRETVPRKNVEPSLRPHSPLQARPVETSDSRSRSPRRPLTPDKVLPPPPGEPTDQKQLPKTPSQAALELKPHIASPSSAEFLLTTGTVPEEPGVGIFVNCDGDVVRGTLEFSAYPTAVIVDGDNSLSGRNQAPEEEQQSGYVLALITRAKNLGGGQVIEIQRWDGSGSENRDWLTSKASTTTGSLSEAAGSMGTMEQLTGISSCLSAVHHNFPEVGRKLRSRRLVMSNLPTHTRQMEESPMSQPSSHDLDVKRNEQEDDFANRLGQGSSHILAWTESSINWVARSPQILRLDSAIDAILQSQSTYKLDLDKLVAITNSLRNAEPRTETDFLSFGYIRQKVSLILFADFMSSGDEKPIRLSEDQLLEGNVDPRVLLSMIPLLCPDIFEGSSGIWIHEGLVSLLSSQITNASGILEFANLSLRPEDTAKINLIKRYLMGWRQRKGFGSITDEKEVFSTVDAALLHILLYQDNTLPAGRMNSSSPTVRAELYSIVDQGVDCFDRAVELLQEFRRLYVLSRLYQSRRMSNKVLETWKRIITGEADAGGELKDGENEVRRYLVQIRDQTLFEDYGTWLATRKPTIGVQVFTDDKSKVRLPPNQVVQLLKLRAPDAVKVYLEHLVFGKKKAQYANDLISYYLDNLLTVLKESSDARSILAQSYESYRALEAPKPTYRQFIIDNAIPAQWWYDRLRFLELLGGSHGAGFSYDVPSILERIQPFEQHLVPESIILDGRQGQHQQALRLLTHGLGDYHTAINYCLLGGSSIFHPTSGPPDPQSLPSQEEQSTLFRYLFTEFLRIKDITNRFEQTSELLCRFSPWFDITHVLTEIPDAWSVELISGFLTSAFRRLLEEKSEALVTKALSGAQNLKISADLIEKCEQLGPTIQTI